MKMAPAPAELRNQIRFFMLECANGNEFDGDILHDKFEPKTDKDKKRINNALWYMKNNKKEITESYFKYKKKHAFYKIDREKLLSNLSNKYRNMLSTTEVVENQEPSSFTFEEAFKSILLYIQRLDKRITKLENKLEEQDQKVPKEIRDMIQKMLK